MTSELILEDVEVGEDALLPGVSGLRGPLSCLSQARFGICYGAYVALLPTIVMDLYGPRSVSGIIGCLYTGCGIGTLIGPWLAGVAYDSWRSYQLPIAAGALFSFAAAACVMPLRGISPRGKKQTLHSG